MSNILKSEISEINKKRVFQSKYNRANHVCTFSKPAYFFKSFENIRSMDKTHAG